MFCPECGYALADDDYFCPECGAKRPEEEAITPEPAPEITPAAPEAVPEEAPVVETFTVDDIIKEEAADSIPVEAPYEAPYEAPSEAPASEPVMPPPPSQTPPQPKEKKERAPLPIKKIIIGLAAIVVIIALIFVCKAIFSGSGSSSALSTKNAWTRVKTDDEEKFIMLSSSGKVIEIEADDPCSFSKSMDASLHTWISDADGSFGTLNCFKNGKQAEISDCVYVSGAALSQEGDYIWYLYSDKEDTEKLDICRYEVSSGKSITVSSKVSPYNGIILSPDGKSAAFTDSKDKALVSVNGKEPAELGKDISVLTLSDSAKLIFAAKYSSKSGDYSLMRYKGVKDDGEKVSGIDDIYCTNLSRTQIVFENSGSLYYAEAKGEKIKIGNNSSRFYVSSAGYYDGWTVGSSGGVDIFNRNDLLSDMIVYYDGSDYVYASYSKGETSKIEKADSYIRLQSGGSAAVYIDDDEVMMSKNGKAFDKFFEADDDIRYLYMAPDYKSAYYTDYYGVLYYTNGKKSSEITDECDSVFKMTDKGVLIFMNEDEELCFSKNGSSAETVSGMEGEITVNSSLGDVLFFVTEADDDEYVLYSVSADGKAKEITRAEFLYF